MFAVIKTGGKQFRVAAEDVITIPKLEVEPGGAVTFDNVLTLSHEGGVEVGAPGVAGAVISGEVIEQTRGPKVIAFKKRRRQNSRRKRGHRQDLTVVRIGSFTLNGSTLSAPASAAAPSAASEPALVESVTVE